MDKEELRAKFLAKMNSPIEAPVEELLNYLNRLWGHGDTDTEVRAWLASRPSNIGDARGIEAWELVLESEISESDLKRLVYAAGNSNADTLDKEEIRVWLAARLEWVKGSL